MNKIYKTNYRYGEGKTEISECEFNSEEYQEWGLINLYLEVKYQTFYGFGGAIIEAAGYSYSLLNEADIPINSITLLLKIQTVKL